MPLSVRDLSTPDATAEHRNDVQLAYYRAPQNADLVQRFMFTRGQGKDNGPKGTAELLDLLRQAALSSMRENRFLFQATYGHGKSHFGLAVANYFGKAVGSLELGAVLSKLAHVLPADRAQNFVDFRQGRAPSLVLLLRGDVVGSLRDGFFRALEDALNDHPESRGVKPPFWFTEAERALEHFQKDPDQARKADAFLEPHRYDLNSLLLDVRGKKSATYALCIEVVKAVTSITPQFGGETSLSDALDWAVANWCGPDKPFGGVLILHDEFSMFVRDFGAFNPVGAPLQELMNGVDKHRGVVLYVALSQHEPERIARGNTQDQENLLKELTRIPKANRHVMFTLLEDVLGAYFKVDSEAWKSFMHQPGMGMHIAEASEVALATYAERYQKQIGWSSEVFQERVAKECFPLHPLTTALLSSLNLEQAASVRSVLGFITQQGGAVQMHFNQDALLEGRPNWVLPIRLVDYFSDMLGEDAFKNYKQVANPDLSLEQTSVLKAMLLQTVSGLPTRIGYAAVIGQLAGLPEKVAFAQLKLLEESRYVRFDPGNKTYSFWAGSNGAVELDRALTKALEERDKAGRLHLLFDQLEHGKNPVNSLDLAQPVPVSVTWGHQDDWCAQEVLLPVHALKAATLTSLKALYSASLEKLPNGRGVILTLIACNEDEVSQVPERIRTLMDAAQDFQAAPLMVLCPLEPTPELHTFLLKLALLQDAVFKSTHEKAVGSQVFEEERLRLNQQAFRGLEKLRNSASLEVPLQARSTLLSRNITPRTANRLPLAMAIVYEVAYAQHLDGFFDQYKAAAPRLKSAVTNVIPVLLKNKLDTTSVGNVENDLISKYVEKEWKLTGSGKQLREPSESRVRYAWQRLDNTFHPKAGRISPREVLRELLNPPYGYDQNTLSLLFAAWVGRNRQNIKIVAGLSKFTGGDDGAKPFLKPIDFLLEMSSTEIGRKDMGAERQKIKEVQERLAQGGVTEGVAKNDLLVLTAFLENYSQEEADFLDDVRLSLDKLESGLRFQQAYEKGVTEFTQALEQAKTISSLVTAGKKLVSLPTLTVVASSKPEKTALQARLVEKTLALTQSLCIQLEKLSQEGDHSLKKSQLEQMRRELITLSFPATLERVDQALDTLEKNLRQLRQREQEARELSVLKAIPTQGTLRGLRQSLATLQKVDPQTDAANLLVDEKYVQVKAGIAQLEQDLQGLPARADSLTDLKATRALQKSLFEDKHRYLDTPEADTLEGVLKRVEHLLEFFMQLEAIREIKTPGEGNELLERLERLGRDHAASLSDAQQERLNLALDRVKEQMKVQVQSALDWLEQMIALVETGDGLDKRTRELDSPPPFLPDEKHSLLVALRARVREHQQALENETQVLERVERFSDRGALVELRARLEELSSIPPSSPQIAKKLEATRHRLEKSVQQLIVQIQGFAARLEAASSVAALRGLGTELTRAQRDYLDSEYAEPIQAWLEQVQATESLFAQAEVLIKQVPNSLEGATDRLQKLGELEKTSRLSEAQRAWFGLSTQVAREQLSEKVRDSQTRLCDWETALTGQNTAKALREQRGRSPSRTFLGVKHQEHLQHLEQRSQSVLEVLEVLERGGGTLPATPAALLEHQNALAAHAQILSGFQGAIQALESYRTRLEEHRLEQEKHASAWLGALQAQFERLQPGNGSKLSALSASLSKPPPFLTQSDRTALEVLGHAVQAAIEDDEVTRIEMLFCEIRSAAKRRECLERLTQMMVQELT